MKKRNSTYKIQYFYAMALGCMLVYCLCATTIGSAQRAFGFRSHLQLGMTSRLSPTFIADAGIQYGSVFAMATGGHELGMGSNAGAIAGGGANALKLYAGYGRFFASNTKLAEGTRNYVIAGLIWCDPRGRGTWDFRYMGDAFHVSFGCRIGN